jgi:4-hydroxybenzoate polyprenyltransferase
MTLNDLMNVDLNPLAHIPAEATYALAGGAIVGLWAILVAVGCVLALLALLWLLTRTCLAIAWIAIGVQWLFRRATPVARIEPTLTRKGH